MVVAGVRAVLEALTLRRCGRHVVDSGRCLILARSGDPLHFGIAAPAQVSAAFLAARLKLAFR